MSHYQFSNTSDDSTCAEVEEYGETLGSVNAEEQYPGRIVPRIDLPEKAHAIAQRLLLREVITTDSEQSFYHHFIKGYMSGYNEQVMSTRIEELEPGRQSITGLLVMLVAHGMERKDALPRAFDEALAISRQYHPASTSERVILEAAEDMFRVAVKEYEDEMKEGEEDEEEFNQETILNQFRELCSKRFLEFQQLSDYKERVAKANIEFTSSVDLAIGELEREAHAHGYQLDSIWETGHNGLNYRCLIRPLTPEEQVYWAEMYKEGVDE